ncbi:MAG: LysR family transcriptional regulator [Synergistaceae bacterium]|jgi:DNA-binding transcriptional LysR family regulator|nr:LysR family transcriptional regulator [Synergistaceae bacterium]
MNISQLKYFLALVRFSSFSKAADYANISQSSMSKQIKSLESELGATLFRREHSKVFLTKAGDAFFVYAKQTLESHEEMLLSLKEQMNDEIQTVKIGSIPVVSAYNLNNAIAEFVSLHPKGTIVIDLMESTQYSVSKALREGHVDIALLRTEYIQDHDDYDRILCLKDEFVMVCREDNNLSAKKSVSLEDIARYPLAILDASSSIHSIILNSFKSGNIPFKVRFMTTRHEVLMKILQKDFCVSLIPERLVNPRLFPCLKTVPLSEPIISEVALMKNKNRKLSRITMIFWEYMKNIMPFDTLQEDYNQNSGQTADRSP